MSRKYILSIMFLVINLIVYFFLLPDAQNMANSHYSSALLGTIFYSVSIFLTGYYLIKYYPKKITIEALIFILIILSFFFWGIKLNNLFCELCMNSG
ncbi:MAG TPA: hypothetical protein VF465_21310 [Flavobacterium sp.]|uniref:hypothetical protein n=1 Tax=Flavobacterium sp. TaxID=239 RepID=UPI002ED07E20